MKAIEVKCPTCRRPVGRRCVPPTFSLFDPASQVVPGKPDEWRYFHVKRIAAAIKSTNAQRKLQRQERATPNLFVTARDRNWIEGLIRAEIRQGRTSRVGLKRAEALLERLGAVRWT